MVEQPDELDEAILINLLFTDTPRFISMLDRLNEKFLNTHLAEEARCMAEVVSEEFNIPSTSCYSSLDSVRMIWRTLASFVSLACIRWVII